MKHPLQTTLLLILLFVTAQVVGLLLVDASIKDVRVNVETGQRVLVHDETAIGERPHLQGYQSVLYLLFGVALGTGILLLLVRFRKMLLWKSWFFLAVFLALYVAFGVLLPKALALLLALSLAVWKIYRPNPWVHNLTEIFLYAGIAVLLVPILDVKWALVLLLAISVYDAWAVWQSKHMVKLAEFQKGSTVFAGLMVPKRGAQRLKAGSAVSTTGGIAAKSAPRTPARGAGTAILGGGDIAFPLLFGGAVMEHTLLVSGSRLVALGASLLVTLGAALALAGLFWYSKKNTYYPAMPFLTAGCLLGWLVTMVL